MTTVYYLAVLLAFTALVNGASRPSELTPDCDASADHWGCVLSDYAVRRNGNIDRLNCLTRPEPLMSWATKVKSSDLFTVFAGDDEENPITSYSPDTIITIGLRVNKFEANFRGILIYGQDDDGNRVGEWLLPDIDSPIYQTPWPNSHPTCGGSLMHTTAELKPLLSLWKWKTPSAGVGRVTFHCLIKSGVANTGAFYWPNGADGPLTLTESSEPAPVKTWYQTRLGQSCDNRCSQEGLLCDRVSLESINSPRKIITEIIPQGFTCHPPFVSGCSRRGPTMGTDGLCYYDDTRCRAQGRDRAAVTCGARSNNPVDGLRMCKCVAVTQAPVEPEETDLSARASASVSPATKSSSSFLLMAFVTLLGITLKSGSKSLTSSLLIVVALVALLSLPSIEAHNFMKMPARAEFTATTTGPCPPRVHNSPHIQVGPNQEFQIEWATGHRSVSYYVLVEADDEHHLKTVTQELIRTYIDGARPEHKQSLPVWYRHGGGDLEPHIHLYEREVPMSDPEFLPRPETFGLWDENDKLFKYKAENYQDNYVEYTNSDIPFIKCVFYFPHYINRGVNSDAVVMKMPQTATPGKHFVFQWLWNGYRDCIDIHYAPNPVQHIYGLPNPDAAFSRIDHCYFPQRREVRTCHRIYNDITICELDCLRNRLCNGVTVMSRLPSHPTRYDNEANLLPDLCKSKVPVDQLERDASTVDVCFTVRARIGSDTQGPYEVVSPGNPAYHSTCYMKGTGRLFEGLSPAPTEPIVAWRHGSKCISCDDVNLNKNITRIPKWNLTDDCRNCDLEPKTDTPPYSPPKLDLQSAGYACDGANNFERLSGGGRHHSCPSGEEDGCVKQLRIRGRGGKWNSAFFDGECAAAAALDPTCSDDIFTRVKSSYVGVPYVFCYCYTKKACCNGCRPVNLGGTWNLYKLDSGLH